MTDDEFDFLRKLYNRANTLRKRFEAMRGDEPEYAKTRLELYELSPVEELIAATPQGIKGMDDRVKEIRTYIHHRTQGVVTLDDKTIIGIIGKAIL